MKYLLILSLLFIVWIMYELWRAPQIDQNGNVIKPAKKLTDLFK
jgi:hypothetical protein